MALHRQGELVSHQVHQVEKSHSSLLPGIVIDICEEAGVSLGDIKAIAVSEGPGSYTGLRIGVSTAKGFAYTLKVPVIAVGTLDVIIEAVKGRFLGNFYLCAMMDARRMEVYTKIEDQDGQAIWEVQPKVLEESSFAEFKQPAYLFGDGMPKFRELVKQENLLFIDDIYPEARNMGRLAWEKYKVENFEDVAYFEPNYLKEWRTTTPKKQLI